MVKFGIFALLVLHISNNYDLTPKLLKLQKRPSDSAPKFPIVQTRPSVFAEWSLASL